MKIRSLTLVLVGPVIAGRTDGHIYSYIRYGGPLMPQYGDKITRIEDRWAVVDYVRSLTPTAGGQP